MKKLRVGIIGFGVGNKHADAFDTHPQCDVVAICDMDEEKCGAARRKYPSCCVTGDANEILEASEVDVVSIATYDNYHFEQTMKALENGKHVFVEKPTCLSREEAKSIRKLLRDNDSLMLSSNLNLRSCPRFRNLRSLIQSGDMGSIFYMEGDYLWGRVHKLKEGWRKDMPFYSIVFGAAIHMMDLLMWLVGETPVQVHGYGNQIATKGAAFQYNDFAALLLRFDNDLIVKVTANGGCVHPHFHRVSVYGTKQTFVHDMGNAFLVGNRNIGENQKKLRDEYPGREKETLIHSFVDAILCKNTEAIVPVEDVFNTMSVCFAAEESIREGRPVNIEYI